MAPKLARIVYQGYQGYVHKFRLADFSKAPLRDAPFHRLRQKTGLIYVVPHCLLNVGYTNESYWRGLAKGYLKQNPIFFFFFFFV